MEDIHQIKVIEFCNIAKNYTICNLNPPPNNTHTHTSCFKFCIRVFLIIFKLSTIWSWLILKEVSDLDGVGGEKIREHFEEFQEVWYHGVLGTACMHCCGCCDSFVFSCYYWEGLIACYFLCYCWWYCSSVHFGVLVIWVYSAFR